MPTDRPPTSILVLGAGELGIEVLKSLATHPLRNGARLAVMKRSQKPLDQLQDQKIEIVNVDLQNESQENLAKEFEKWEMVVNCSGMALTPETQVKIAKAVLQAGVGRYYPCRSL
jgi:saccharopine dehydrogenase-like NADP-dependent oxidoreductase